MRIGMLIAVEIESFLGKYKSKIIKKSTAGFDVYNMSKNGAEIFAIHSGAGQIYAAAATELLISEYKVDYIINYGVVGAMTEESSVLSACVVESVVHYNFDTSDADGCEIGRHMNYPSIYIPTDKKLMELALKVEPKLKAVVCASGEKFIGSREEKKKIHDDFKSDICDMESAAIVLIADKSKVPCVLIKTISDSLNGGADEFYKAFDDASKVCMDICDKLIAEILH